MPETSYFTDKTEAPDLENLSIVLGKQFDAWTKIREHVFNSSEFPVKEEWNFSKYGWNCRLKGKKSVIIYLMPCKGCFNASFVFGEKATNTALESDISNDIKNVIREARVYAEGRGFRIKVTASAMISDIRKLIDIKLSSS
jgi:hypothetical protein